MNILSLPSELVQGVFRHLLPDIGLRRAARLRRVCRVFDQEILYALFTIQYFNLHSAARAKHISRPMTVRYLVTRAYIEHNTNPFLSVVFRLAQELGGNSSKEKQLEFVNVLFSSMTTYQGSVEMLSRMQGESLSYSRLLIPDPSTRLSIAVVLGKVDEAKRLLAGGADANITSDFGSPLAVAVNTGRVEVVQMLLKYGAKVNHGVRVFPAGWTPQRCTWRASIFTNKGQSLTILPHGRYVIISSSDGDEQATSHGTKKDEEKLLRVLMHKCAACRGSRYVMAIMDGTNADTRGSVKMMLSPDLKVDLRDRTGLTALHRSSQKGYWHLTRFLLENGADVKAYCNYRGKTACALSLALEKGHYSVVKLLFDHGASAHASSWQACLQSAVRKNNTAQIRLLCDLDRRHLAIWRWDRVEPGRQGQWTTFGTDLLETAVSKSRHEIVHLLTVEYGVNARGMGQA